jgi:hypothetical protein
MDELKIQVDSIELYLQESRRRLDAYEREARSNLRIKVSGMRDALLQGERRIEQVITDMQCFMRSIECHPANEVDLKPQITWLSGCIAIILVDLQTSESKAQEAMTQTMDYEIKVNSISQDIVVQQQELDIVEHRGKELANWEERQLRDSEILVREKESSVKQKTRDIESKTKQGVDLQALLDDYQGTLDQEQMSLANARREAESKKDTAILGFVSLH